MDDTPIDSLVSDLAAADPADAAEIADEIATRLGSDLEQGDPDAAAPPT